MKKIFVYSLAAFSLLFASCAKSEVELPATVEGEGSVSLRILTDTRADDGSYNALDYYTIRIYDSEGGLIRKYAPVVPMPETLSLLAGNYSLDVEAGDMSKATFTNKSYHGTQNFTVTAGQNTNVTVTCTLLNALVSVEYGDALASTLDAGYTTTVAMGGDRLVYTAPATGYFLPEKEGSDLTWTFAGVHPEKGEIAKSGTLPVKAGHRYTLKLNYSEDAAGFLSFELTVEEPTPENGGDIIIFSPEPTFKGEDFDMGTAQKFYNTTKNILVTSPNALSTLKLEVEGTEYDLAGGTVPGITLTKTDELNWVVTLSDDFFSPMAGGDHELLFTATDVEGGTGKAAATFTTQGIVAATAADYDLWLNTGDIRVKVFDPSVSSVQVKLRKGDGAWKSYTATRTDDETFTAHVEPAWTEAANLNGEKVYRPDNTTGIFANADYEAKAVIAGVEKDAVAAFTTTVDQTIPYGDFEDGSLSCFGNNNKPGQVGFWGSGNNSFTSSLCKPATFDGMGGAQCAKMSATSALGLLGAGNLFTGSFEKPVTQGTVGFGQDYDWKARPTALRLKYYAQIGTVNLTKYKDESGSDPIASGQPDRARIYVAIIDWTAPHGVSSGTSAPSGMWDPEATSSVDEGAIIGYGSLYIEGETGGNRMITVDLPISFYDKVAKPSNAYKIVIACSTSAYGDYMCGNDKNVLYVDDFEWVY